MTKVWILQRRCRYSKVLGGLWPVKCQSSTTNLELRVGAIFSTALGWQVQWPVTGSSNRITLFVPVLVTVRAVRSSLLEYSFVGSEA